MALKQLLGDLPLSTFLDEHFLKLPFALAGGCREFVELGSWKVLEHLLAQQGADVIAGKASGEQAATVPASVEEAQVLIGQGYTIGVRQAQRHHAGLASLAADFRADFLADVDIHLYCTPAGEAGFGWHYDAEDVFILQTQGSKDWLLRKNTVNPWPLIETLPADMRYGAEIMPLVRCRLKQGDWLYIPAGYWHRTEAQEQSCSLSVGIATPTGLDVWDFLRSKLLDSLRWRQRLPPLGTAAGASEQDVVAGLCDHFSELGRDAAMLLAQPQFAREFLASRRQGHS